LLVILVITVLGAGAMTGPLGTVPATGEARSREPVIRPEAELFGQHPGYGFAGLGVNTATGNYTQQVVDLPVSTGLLSWGRAYNSLKGGDGALGRGWTSTLSAHVVETPDGNVTFHDDDGRVLVFAPDGEGGYRRPQDLRAELTRDVAGGFTMRFFSSETWRFDTVGRLIQRLSEGHRVTLAYDVEGRLQTVIDSTGERLSLSYGPRGRLTKVAVSDGREVSYGYTAQGALSSVTGPDGAVTRYEVTASGLVQRVTDADGRMAVANTYDAGGRVIQQEFPGGGNASFAYHDDQGRTTTITSLPGDTRVTFQHDAAGRLVQATDPLGNATTSTFDDDGRLVEAITRGGSRTRLLYDAHDNVLSETTAGATTNYGYDDQDRLISVTDPTGGVTRYEYTADGRTPSQVTDPTGNPTRYTVVDGLVVERADAEGAITRYTYDAQRRLIAVTDPLGHTTRYSYDAPGNLVAVTDPLGHTTRYSYDAAGRRTSETDPLGATTRYTYSTQGLLLKTTDPDGAVTSYEYDRAGRRVSSTDPLGRTTTYGYDADGNQISSTNPAGAITRYDYDGLGRVDTMTDPTGEVTRYAYNADGQQTERTEARGSEVTARDTRGNITAMTDAAGRTTRFEYDDAGREVARIGPTGARWQTRYDKAGRTTAEIDPTGATTRYQYSPTGRRVAETDPIGRTTRYDYDAAGQRTQVIDPAGGVTRYEYDADGQQISETSPAGLVTRFEYDAAHRRIAVTDPRGGITRYAYNPRGEQTRSVSPGGAVRKLRYDAAGQLVAAEDPLGATTRYDYDDAGNLTALTDAKGAVWRSAYDKAGRQTSSTDPLGRTTKLTYNTLGGLTSITEPSGKKTRMERDSVGQLTRRIAADGNEVSFTYDGAGRRTSMSDATGATRYAYDPAGRLVKVTKPDGQVFSSRYDAAGQRLELDYPDGHTVNYRYDRNGRLVGLLDSKAGDAEYALDPDGRLLKEHLPKKWTREYEYDSTLLQAYSERRRGAPAEDTRFTRDADGRIARQADRGQTSTYAYDAAGQLVSATGQRGGTVRATYDTVGNRTAITRAGVTTRLRYDAADQLVATDTGPHHVDYHYDPSGRLTKRVGHKDQLTIAYDGFGLPETTTHKRGGVKSTQRATYDGDDLLAKLDVARVPGNAPPQTSTTRYAWSVGDEAPQILTQRGEDAADFVYGYGRVFANTADDTAIFARDAHGSTIRTAQTKPWAQAMDYDVFGNPESAGTPALSTPRFGYRSELAVGSQVYLRARTYDATVGRFTSRDPVATQPGQPDTISSYAYANNDPVNASDPLGKWAVSDMAFLIPFPDPPIPTPDPSPDDRFSQSARGEFSQQDRFRQEPGPGQFRQHDRVPTLEQRDRPCRTVNRQGRTEPQGWNERMWAEGVLLGGTAFGGAGILATIKLVNALGGTFAIGYSLASTTQFGVLGLKTGAGVYFGPGGEFGIYGTIGADLGAILGASATIVQTAVKGGPNNLAGPAITAEVAGGEIAVVGAAALFSPQPLLAGRFGVKFLGMAASVGVGVGWPFNVYGSLSDTRISSARPRAIWCG